MKTYQWFETCYVSSLCCGCCHRYSDMPNGPKINISVVKKKRKKNTYQQHRHSDVPNGPKINISVVKKKRKEREKKAY